MANPEHLDRLLQGMWVWNRWRRETLCVAPDFSGAKLSDVDLSGANLSNANLSNVNLSNADLSGADLSGANLSNADLSDANLGGTDLNNADLSQASLRSADLSGANLNNADLNNTNLSDANLNSVNLHNANLRSTDLSGANLNNAELNQANLSNSNLSKTNLEKANLEGANLVRAHLVDASLNGANLRNAKLQSAFLSGCDLTYADLTHADLTSAYLGHATLIRTRFIDARLKNADLTRVRAWETIFNNAELTGACIQDWGIAPSTRFKNIVCEYIFLKTGQRDRLPHDPNQIFAPGEFTKRYQIVLETVDLFFNDGIDWRAFLDSLQDLKTQYGNDLNIQGIEKKAGGSFLVRLEVPSDADKGTIERAAKELYETKLQILEAKYHAELQAKEREIKIYKQQSADILELAKLAASRPITVEAKAVAENQSSSESYSNTFNNSPIGNFANKMQDQASQQTNQYIGANLNEITTLIHSLRNIAESFPEAQRAEAIEHLEDLETDLKQPPEKRKISRIKAALLTLVGIATAIGGTVASTNEFVTHVQELSEKLNIPLPIEQVKPSESAIDIKPIDATEP